MSVFIMNKNDRDLLNRSIEALMLNPDTRPAPQSPRMDREEGIENRVKSAVSSPLGSHACKLSDDLADISNTRREPAILANNISFERLNEVMGNSIKNLTIQPLGDISNVRVVPRNPKKTGFAENS